MIFLKMNNNLIYISLFRFNYEYLSNDREFSVNLYLILKILCRNIIYKISMKFVHVKNDVWKFENLIYIIIITQL